MEIVLLGLQSGAQYALLATALVIIFNTTGVVNFAVGALATIAVYSAISFGSGGIPGWMTIVLACIVVAAASIILERLVATPLTRKFPRDGGEVILIATLLVFVVTERVIALVWGAGPRPFPESTSITGTVTIFGTSVTKPALTTYLVAAVVLLTTHLLLKRTRLGMTVRAVAENDRAVGLLGVPGGRYRLGTWGYAGILIALSGLLLANTVTPTPNMASSVFLKAVAGTALGGITSLGGAAVGALVVGLAEAFTVVYIGPGFAAVMPMLIIFITLIVRPSGVFGRPETVRV